MNQPILITYASRSGATAGVAEAIAHCFAECGDLVEVRPMNEVVDLSPYRALVAGSAIQGQKWLPEAMRFLRAHQAELRRVPFAAFLTCITLSMKGSESYRDGVSAWMAPVRALVRPVSEGLFAGALDFSKMPLTPRTLMMRIPVMLGLWKVGDHRDWPAIHAWAEETRKRLS